MKNFLLLFYFLLYAQLSHSQEFDLSNFSVSHTFDYIYFDGDKKYTLVSLDEKKLITSKVLSYNHPFEELVIVKDHRDIPVKIGSINLFPDLKEGEKPNYTCKPTTIVITNIVYFNCDIHIFSIEDIRIRSNLLK